MNKVMLAVVALLFTTVAQAGVWKAVEQGTIGVQSNDNKASLVLTTVTNEENLNESGLAFYYYPANQPEVCDVYKDVFQQFAVNGKMINFKKFCFPGSKQTVGYTPTTSKDASVLVAQLTAGTVTEIQLDNETFSTDQFAEQVDVLLAD